MKEIFKVCVEDINAPKDDKFIWEIPLLNNLDTEDFEKIAKFIFKTEYLSIEHKYYDYAEEQEKKRQSVMANPRDGYRGFVTSGSFYIHDWMLSGGYAYAIIKTTESSYKIWVKQDFIHDNIKEYLGDKISEML